MPDLVAPDWGKIIEKHAERVFRIAYRILGSVHDAEDVSQDVFTEAMAVHKSGPVRTWTGLMVRLATVRSIDRLRRDQGRPESLPSTDVSPLATQRPDQELIAAELATWLRGELRMLPDRQAAIFSLAYHWKQRAGDVTRDSQPVINRDKSHGRVSPVLRLTLAASVMAIVVGGFALLNIPFGNNNVYAQVAERLELLSVVRRRFSFQSNPRTIGTTLVVRS